MGILEPALVGEQKIVHLPETALERGSLGGAGSRPRPWMARADREMAEHSTRRVGLTGEPDRERRAVRAFEVGVLDHERRVLGAPNMVLRRRRWDGSGAQPAHGR